MRIIPIFVLWLVSVLSFGQSAVEWSPTYVEWSPTHKVTLEDFQSPQTEISNELNTYSIFPSTTMDFDFQMTTGEFIFTKNFNSRVTATFNRSAAVITAPDTLTARKLVNFGQYSFDLVELYSRKFRKAMYEQKGVFSDVSFFKSIHTKLQKQLNEEVARVLKATDLGINSELLAKEHEEVLSQLEGLPDFCKACKPPKKKKKKR